MKQKPNWIIVDLKRRKAIYGVKEVTMRFSTSNVALEVAQKLFEKNEEFLILNVVEDLGLT